MRALKNISPMLAKLHDAPFDDEGWLFEIKWDGYRAIAVKNDTIELISRKNISFNEAYPSIVTALARLPGQFILDGEIVILDKQGRSRFQLLQNYQRRSELPYYFVFDILYYNGKNLTSHPLLQRKQILKKLLAKAPPRIRFGDHILAKGKAFFRVALKQGLEGIIAKKIDSPYQFHRSHDWLKIKAKMGQEVVIGGFTAPKGGRKYFGALLVGVYQKNKLIYAGHIGGGFNEELLEEVYQKLQKITSDSCPFAQKPRPNSPATWVKPKLVCEVAFAEWTDEGIMRQPIFKGLRTDKAPKEIVREVPE